MKCRRYRCEAIAAAWHVSDQAVLAAAAILGYRFLGGYLYATRDEVKPGSPFQREATLADKMLSRRRQAQHETLAP